MFIRLALFLITLGACSVPQPQETVSDRLFDFSRSPTYLMDEWKRISRKGYHALIRRASFNGQWEEETIATERWSPEDWRSALNLLLDLKLKTHLFDENYVVDTLREEDSKDFQLQARAKDDDSEFSELRAEFENQSLVCFSYFKKANTLLYQQERWVHYYPDNKFTVTGSFRVAGAEEKPFEFSLKFLKSDSF